ncbi:hypothetical protein, partial [Kaarinaea lacus]
WLMGHADRALELINQATSRATEVKHPFSMAYASYFSSVIHQLRGDVKKAGEMAKQTLKLCEQYEFRFWHAMANMMNIWSQFEMTGDNKLINQYIEVMDKNLKLGSRLALTFHHSLLVRMYIKAEKWEDAEVVIDGAINKLNTHHEYFFQPELHRLKALISWKHKSASHNELDAYFNEAIHVAQRQSSTGLELRAVIDYCQYLISIDQAENAELKLNEVLQKVNGGLSTQDYKQAEQLLAQIRETSTRQVESSTN